MNAEQHTPPDAVVEDWNYDKRLIRFTKNGMSFWWIQRLEAGVWRGGTGPIGSERAALDIWNR